MVPQYVHTEIKFLEIVGENTLVKDLTGEYNCHILIKILFFNGFKKYFELYIKFIKVHVIVVKLRVCFSSYRILSRYDLYNILCTFLSVPWCSVTEIIILCLYCIKFQHSIVESKHTHTHTHTYSICFTGKIRSEGIREVFEY